MLTVSKATADFFEASVSSAGDSRNGGRAKATANWMTTELTSLLHASGREIEESPISARALAGMLDLVDDGTISTKMAKDVFEEMFKTGTPPKRIAEERGLVQISDADAVQPAVVEAMSDNPSPVADYLAGKEVAMKFLVGQVMKITRGKANPQLVAEMLRGMRWGPFCSCIIPAGPQPGIP